jgi:hypothetical protein
VQRVLAWRDASDAKPPLVVAERTIRSRFESDLEREHIARRAARLELHEGARDGLPLPAASIVPVTCRRG